MGVCADVAGACFGAGDFYKWEGRFVKKMIERGFGISKYPDMKSSFCIADTAGGKTICPDGTIVKCWKDASHPEEAIGHLVTPDLTEAEMIRNRLKWQTWDPFEKSGCRECHVLPNCMGGCPYDGMRYEQTERGQCSALLDSIDDVIKSTYQHKKAMEESQRRKAREGRSR
jgi:uncharacterized protein